MVAPYQGLLHWVDQPRSGVTQSTGNPWKSVQFVLKYLNHQMKEEFIVFDMQGVENVDRLLSLPLGTEIRVSWRPQARKWDDQQGQTKWFGAFNAFNFRVGPFDQTAPQQVPPQQPQYPPMGGFQSNISFTQPQQPSQYAQQPAYPPQSQYQQPMAPQPAPAPGPMFPDGQTPDDDLPW